MARPTRFEQDEQASRAGRSAGWYHFDDGHKTFGEQDDELDSMIPQIAAPMGGQPGAPPGPAPMGAPAPMGGPAPIGAPSPMGGPELIDLGDAAGETNGASHGEVPVGETGLSMSVDTSPGPPGMSYPPGMAPQPIAPDPEEAQIEEFSRAGLAQIEEENIRQQEQLAADVESARSLAFEKKTHRDQAFADKEMAKAQAQQRAAQEAQKEHEDKLERYEAERSEVAQSDVSGEFADDALGSIIGLVGAVMAGAIGDEKWARFVDKRIHASAQQKIRQRNSKLDQLANRLGSEKQAIAEYKQSAWNAVKSQVEAEAKQRNIQLEQDERKVVRALANQKAGSAASEARKASYEKQYLGSVQDEQRDYTRGRDAAKDELAERSADRADKGQRQQYGLGVRSAERGDRSLDLQEARDAKASAKAAAAGSADKPSMRGGLDLNVPVGQESKDAQTRNAYAAQFNEKNANDAGGMKAYSKNHSQIAALKETRDRLAHLYKVQPDKNGYFPKSSDTYGTGATGPGIWNNWEFGTFDSEDTRALKDAWTKVEENTRSQWNAEPNGEVAQQKFQMVAVPKRDADVGIKLSELTEAIKRLEQDNGASVGAHVRAAYDKRNNSPFGGSMSGGIRPVAATETR